jgi:hypothetical protein
MLPLLQERQLYKQMVELDTQRFSGAGPHQQLQRHSWQVKLKNRHLQEQQRSQSLYSWNHDSIPLSAVHGLLGLGLLHCRGQWLVAH